MPNEEAREKAFDEWMGGLEPNHGAPEMIEAARVKVRNDAYELTKVRYEPVTSRDFQMFCEGWYARQNLAQTDTAVRDAVAAERKRLAEKAKDLLDVADNSMGDFYEGACSWLASEFADEIAGDAGREG